MNIFLWICFLFRKFWPIESKISKLLSQQNLKRIPHALFFFSEQPLVRVLVVAMAYQEQQQQYIVVYRRRQQEGRLFSPDKRDGNHWLHLNKKHTHYSDHVQASVDLSIICPGHHRSQVGLEGDLGNVIIFLHGAQKY